MTSCAVCRRTIATLDEQLTYAAMGRPLFKVHKVPCAQYVSAGVSLLSLVAAKGLHGYMLRRAPQLVKVIEQVRQLSEG